jgi:hypothetical protein
MGPEHTPLRPRAPGAKGRYRGRRHHGGSRRRAPLPPLSRPGPGGGPRRSPPDGANRRSARRAPRQPPAGVHLPGGRLPRPVCRRGEHLPPRRDSAQRTAPMGPLSDSILCGGPEGPGGGGRGGRVPRTECRDRARTSGSYRARTGASWRSTSRTLCPIMPVHFGTTLEAWAPPRYMYKWFSCPGRTRRRTTEEHHTDWTSRSTVLNTGSLRHFTVGHPIQDRCLLVRPGSFLTHEKWTVNLRESGVLCEKYQRFLACSTYE